MTPSIASRQRRYVACGTFEARGRGRGRARPPGAPVSWATALVVVREEGAPGSTADVQHAGPGIVAQGGPHRDLTPVRSQSGHSRAGANSRRSRALRRAPDAAPERRLSPAREERRTAFTYGAPSTCPASRLGDRCCRPLRTPPGSIGAPADTKDAQVSPGHPVAHRRAEALDDRVELGLSHSWVEAPVDRDRTE